jgi:hypothetical protein
MPVAADKTFKGLYSQQSGGGPFWKFKERPVGTAYEGIVARPVTEADVTEQTDPQGKVQTQRDGSARVQLNVPMLMMPSQDYPDGIARLGIRGDMLGKLPAAMAAVGAPKDPKSDSYVPEAGAYIRVELTNLQRVPGVAQPRQVYRIDYRRPDDPHTMEVRGRIEAAHAYLATAPGQFQQPQQNGYYPGAHQPAPGYPAPGYQQMPQQGYQQVPPQPGQMPGGQYPAAPAPVQAPAPAPAGQQPVVTTPPAPAMASVGSPAVPAPGPAPAASQQPGPQTPGIPPTAAPGPTPGAPAAAPGQPAGGMPVGQIDPAAWAALSDEQKEAWLKVTGQAAPTQ